MPLINVIKPFGLRLGSGRERQDFGIGEHFVSDEELGHWFVQACLQDGRAALVPETAETDEPEGSGKEQSPTGEKLEAPVATEDAAGGDIDPKGDAPGTDTDADVSGVGLDADVDGDGADEDSAESGDAPAVPTREELMALTVAQLKEMAARCGLALASNATKAVIVDALLAGQGGQ